MCGAEFDIEPTEVEKVLYRNGIYCDSVAIKTALVCGRRQAPRGVVAVAGDHREKPQVGL
jgi:hypothetical protein